MAQLLNSTRFKSPSTAASSFNITIPATSAGSKLICVGGGGAVITAKLGVGGTSFTKRTTSLNSREVAAQDIVDSTGGTTTIQITLNGPENVDGVIYEFASGALGNFMTGATQSDPGGTSSITSEGRVVVGTITTTGPAVVFAMFTAGNPGTPPATEKFFNFEPLGKQYANEFIATDSSKSHYWSMIAVSDQASAATISAQSSRIIGAGENQSVVWAYQDLTPGTPTYTNPYANAIAAENSLPGSIYSSWFGSDTSSIVAGYTDAQSYLPGDTVNFKVDSLNAAFTIDILRAGYYGYAVFGARKKATVTGSPASQPAPTVNSFGGTVCAWSTTATWTIPNDAVPGIYIYNMKVTGGIAQGIFVVRSAVPATRQNQIMIAPADMTWQAYNLWGSTNDSGTGTLGFTGRSLYGQAPSGSSTTRAFAVSFDRPMGTISSNKGTFYWDSEAALVSFLEANGYDLAYYSMIDLDKNTAIPSRYQVAVSMGHSEYWTANVRDAYENARDAGTNLFLTTSNTALWHVRFDPADTNRRNIICYKDSHDTTGYDNATKYDPTTYTGTWRDSRTNAGGVNNTNRRPESGVTGLWFIGNGTFEETTVVPSTYRSLPIWRNTAVASSVTITPRGTATAVINTPGTQLSFTQPSGTQAGDLLIVAVSFTGNPGNLNPDAPFRRVRLTTISNSETLCIFVGYARTAGSQTLIFGWTGGTSVNASGALIAYGNAVWEDIESSVVADTGGGSTHTTRSISNNGTTRWAVCVFGDNDTSGSSKTASWTAGSGLTSRVQADNSAGAGPWSSVAIMDTNGAVSQGAHQYSATAQFANPKAFAGIMYISPGVPLSPYTIGLEWDYAKPEEPTTPKNMVFLSQQVVPLRGQAANYNGNGYSENAVVRYGMVMYQSASGALVFNSGSWRTTIGLSRFRKGTLDLSGDVDPAMQQMVLNILCDMGVNPTTILDTTANLNATALVSPGPAAPASSYGLPVATSTSYQNIFQATPPQNYDASDSIPYSLGTVFTSAVGGKVYGLRWHFPGTLPDAPVVGTLYSWTTETTGSALATVTFTNAQSGWNDMLFASPVTIAANTKYVASVWTDLRYVSSSSVFASSGVTNGDLTAIQDTAGAHNGKFVTIGTPSYPTGTFGSNSYLVDVMFTGSGFEGWGIPM